MSNLNRPAVRCGAVALRLLNHNDTKEKFNRIDTRGKRNAGPSVESGQGRKRIRTEACVNGRFYWSPSAEHGLETASVVAPRNRARSNSPWSASMRAARLA